MIIALYELRVTVEPTGILIQHYKYPVKCTGKNYLPVPVTDELSAEGYEYRLNSRVPVSEIGVVRRTARFDATSNVGREIYHLEGGLEAAKKLVVESVNNIINKMNGEMALMHEAWVIRKERPRRKP